MSVTQILCFCHVWTEHCRWGSSHLQSVMQCLCTGVVGVASIDALHSLINPESWGGGAGEICHTSKSYQHPLNTSYYYTQYTCSMSHEPRWKEQSSHCDHNQRRNGRNGTTGCAVGMIYLVSVSFTLGCVCQTVVQNHKVNIECIFRKSAKSLYDKFGILTFVRRLIGCIKSTSNILWHTSYHLYICMTFITCNS